MIEWTRHAIWWHVYPLGFTGAPVHGWDGESQADLHRLKRIENWLDYAQELGVSGLALGPVFASEKHGYDTVDYFHIDGRLGTDEDIDSLIAASHGRGLKIMFDGVFNHVAQSFPQYQQALAGGPDSEFAGWFHLDWSGDEPTHRNFEGHDELVALNHDNPEVQDYIAGVMSHWLDRGVDSWRLDAAYAVPPRFWSAVLPKVREKHPDAYFLGEVIHGDYDRIVSASTLDSVTQYELWKAIWSGLSEKNFFELSHAMERHNGWLDAFVPATFIGNHDVNRIASVIEDERHLVHAIVVLFTIGGMPMIYYGDEQAFRGIKEERVGGDDEVRPEYPSSPDDLAPYGWPVFRIHQQLIGLRRRNPWLYTARTEAIELTNTALVYRAHADGNALTVALNLGDDPVNYAVQGSEVLAGEADLQGGRVTVPPHGWVVVG